MGQNCGSYGVKVWYLGGVTLWVTGGNVGVAIVGWGDIHYIIYYGEYLVVCCKKYSLKINDISVAFQHIYVIAVRYICYDMLRRLRYISYGDSRYFTPIYIICRGYFIGFLETLQYFIYSLD